MDEILERIARQRRVKLRGSVVDDIRALRGSLNGQDRNGAKWERNGVVLDGEGCFLTKYVSQNNGS
jgi:hypothetical protein